MARVVTIQVKPEKMDECISIFREVNAPSIAERSGFDHGHWWVDRTSGEATSVTFWENEEDEETSRANVPRLVAGMSHVLASDEVLPGDLRGGARAVSCRALRESQLYLREGFLRGSARTKKGQGSSLK